MRLVCFNLCRAVRERAGVKRGIGAKRGIGSGRGISKDEGSSRMHRLDYFGRISGSTIASRLVVFGHRDTAATTATATAATVVVRRGGLLSGRRGWRDEKLLVAEVVPPGRAAQSRTLDTSCMRWR